MLTTLSKDNILISLSRSILVIYNLRYAQCKALYLCTPGRAAGLSRGSAGGRHPSEGMRVSRVPSLALRRRAWCFAFADGVCLCKVRGSESHGALGRWGPRTHDTPPSWRWHREELNGRRWHREELNGRDIATRSAMMRNQGR